MSVDRKRKLDDNRNDSRSSVRPRTSDVGGKDGYSSSSRSGPHSSSAHYNAPAHHSQHNSSSLGHSNDRDHRGGGAVSGRDMYSSRKMQFASDAKLFVGNISSETTEAELKDLFSKYGNNADVHLNVQKRIAFVSIDYKHNAQLAKHELQGRPVHGRPLIVRWALANNALWVGDLNPCVTDEILWEAFSQFGALENTVVVSDQETRQSKGYGYIYFVDRRDCGRAFKHCQEKMFVLSSSPRPIRVEMLRADTQGFSESDLSMTPQVKAELQVPPHFVAQGTLEYEFACEWRDLVGKYQADKSALKQQHLENVANLWRTQQERFRVHEQRERELSEQRRQEEARRVQLLETQQALQAKAQALQQQMLQLQQQTQWAQQQQQKLIQVARLHNLEDALPASQVPPMSSSSGYRGQPDHYNGAGGGRWPQDDLRGWR
eukprot:gnl/Hemi2/3826_TR1347_c0_g1_i1.p1 gnl/Hemi2/3826_TR1347_c0_g1~~gnl/Hemi2/3826_TR1347_c0_g1_i1.p1  ORF type:complete len:433 (-),score=68.40 gnl/Hemi2/3826_TR1347_c0_g1_i1:292-1590(-)